MVFSLEYKNSNRLTVNNKDQNIHPETRSRKSFLIAVFLRNSGFNMMLKGVLETAQEHGYSILLFNSQNDPEAELKHITTICQKRADGAV